MTYEQKDKTAFVPKGDNRRATARMLVGLADKHGISQQSIQSSNDGFYVTEEIADLIGAEDFDAEAIIEEFNAEQDKSIPATQTYPQTHEGRGDTTAGGNQNTKTENEVDGHGNLVGYNTDETDGPASQEPQGQDDEEIEVVDYSEWEYAALKAEVEERDLEVENKRAETLVAALLADDAAKQAAFDDETE